MSHEEFRGPYRSPEQKNILSSGTHRRSVNQPLTDQSQLI